MAIFPKCVGIISVLVTGTAFARPIVDGANVHTRIFNDIPGSTITVVDNYPALISVEDAHVFGGGFANRHNFRLAAGASDASFANSDGFRFAADVTITGSARPEGGLNVSPWWSQQVEGTFMLDSNSGEIAVFGGRLPFYSFTGSHGVTYTLGQTARLGITYDPRDLTGGLPGVIRYSLTLNGNDYISPLLPFDEGNPAEDPPHGLWGILNDAMIGGYVQIRGSNSDPANLGFIRWSNIEFVPAMRLPTPTLLSQREPVVPSNCAPGFVSGLHPLCDEFYLHSGEVFVDAVDMRIKGRGLDFVWARKYRSRSDTTYVQGNNWDYSYNIFLQPAGQDVIVNNGWGRSDTYLRQPDGSWSRPEFFRRLVQNVDGSYTLTFADTSTWNFRPLTAGPEAGKISSIVDRNLNTLSFAYGAGGRLVGVTDTLGRLVQIAYDPQGQISSVVDFSGRQVEYSYYDGVVPGGMAGDLRSATLPAVTGTPNGNDFPTGKTTSYTYSTGFADDRLNHNLLSITDARGATYMVNQYAPTTNAADLLFDRVIARQLGDPGDLMTIAYTALVPSPTNGSAVVMSRVTDRNSNVKEFFYDSFNRLVVQRELTRGLHNPEPAAYERRWTYNVDALSTHIEHPNGGSEDLIYDTANIDPRARGNLLVATRHAGPLGGDQSSITELFEYGTFGGCCGTSFVTRHTDGRGNVTRHDYDARGNRIRSIAPIASIVHEWEYNQFGQVVKHIHPGNGLNGAGCRRVDTYAYYTSGPQRGYLQSEVTDASDPLACPGSHFALATTFEYDARGNVIARTNPRGCRTDLVVNQLDQVVRETKPPVNPPANPARHEVDTFYDANNNVVRIDVQNVLDSGSVDPNNSHFSKIFDYDTLNFNIRVAIERRGVQLLPNVTTYAQISPVDRLFFVTTEYVYDRNRNRSLVRSGEAVNGNMPFAVVRTDYDERDLPLRVVRAPGAPGADGQSTATFDYDDNGNMIRHSGGIESGPRTTAFTYDGFDRSTSVTDAMGNVSRTAYDPNGNPGGERSPGVPNGFAKTYEGELFDSPGSKSNRLLFNSSITFDAMNRPTRAEVAHFDVETGQSIGDGASATTRQYNGLSQLVSETNDNGHTTIMTYDSMNRLRTTTDPKGNTVSKTYDTASNVVTITTTHRSDLGASDESFTTTNQYDCLDRLISTTDNAGSVTTSGYDSRNNETLTIDALGRVVQSVFDGLDRRVRTARDMNGNGQPLEPVDILVFQAWDDNSLLRTQVDGHGNTTRYSYDALDRKISERCADGTLKTWTYDAHDDRVTSLDANANAVAMQYDALHRLTHKSITPGPGVAGPASGGSSFEQFVYDGLSRLVAITDDDSTILRAHDSLDHVIRESLNGKTTHCTYDGEGNEVLCQYPGGQVVSRSFDALEHVRQVRDGAGGPLIAQYDYVGPKRVQRRTNGNGTRSDFSYDGITGVPNPPGDFGVEQMVRARHTRIADGAVIDDRTFAWDRVSNKTERRDVRPGGPALAHAYSYDAVNRLTRTQVTAPSGLVRDESYLLDLVSNRTTVSGGEHPGSYTCDGALPEPGDCEANQYTETPFDRRTYDRNGNLIGTVAPCAADWNNSGLVNSQDFFDFLGSFFANAADFNLDGLTNSQDFFDFLGAFFLPCAAPGRQSQIVYDYRNQMVSYSGIDGVVSTYRYDALGRRIQRTVDTQAINGGPYLTRYFFNGVQDIEERGIGETPSATYVYGIDVDEVVLMRRGADYYYHADDLHNVMAVTDELGQAVERYEYADYGQPRFYSAGGTPLARSAIGNPCLFTGRRFDDESGLLYFRTRYLDPLAGRFTTRDTIGIWGDTENLGNAYAYAGSNPWSMVDPEGTKGKLRKALKAVGNAVQSAITWVGQTGQKAAKVVGGTAFTMLGLAISPFRFVQRIVTSLVVHAVTGSKIKTRYGNYCGAGDLVYGARNRAVDELDKCCEAHDFDGGFDGPDSWSLWHSPFGSVAWNLNRELCNCARKASCATKECRSFRRDVLIFWCARLFG